MIFRIQTSSSHTKFSKTCRDAVVIGESEYTKERGKGEGTWHEILCVHADELDVCAQEMIRNERNAAAGRCSVVGKNTNKIRKYADDVVSRTAYTYRIMYFRRFS